MKYPKLEGVVLTLISIQKIMILCNKKRKLGGETNNTASSIDEGMNLFLLLFAFNDII